MKKSKAGIYKISFQCSHLNVYYGSTNKFNRRKSQHLHLLRRGKHSNPILQSYFNKYGETSFKFSKVETILDEDEEYIVKREQYYIDALESNQDIKTLNCNLEAGRPPYT